MGWKKNKINQKMYKIRPISNNLKYQQIIKKSLQYQF